MQLDPQETHDRQHQKYNFKRQHKQHTICLVNQSHINIMGMDKDHQTGKHNKCNQQIIMTMATMKHRNTTTMVTRSHNHSQEDGGEEDEVLVHHQHTMATNHKRDLTHQIQTLTEAHGFTTIHREEATNHGVEMNNHQL